MIKRFKRLRFGVLFLCLMGAQLNAQPPADFEETLVASNLGSTTAMAFAPDGRLFVCKQTGQLLVIKNGVLLANPFLEVRTLVDSDRGFLGMTFDPNFASNRHLYVFYTFAEGPRNRISRFTASQTNPDMAEPGSEIVLVDNIATAFIHNGGGLHFGRDGMLYASTGDAHNPEAAQALSQLEGKILRLDPSSYPNIIPADNPFVGTPDAREEIWALGLRNPFTFAIDPAADRMFINDVGQDSWEEVNLGIRGANYGWPLCEGNCPDPRFQNPIYTYSHSEGRAITGGIFYRANQFPTEYDGDYFFADYVENWIRRLKVSTNEVTTFATGVNAGILDLDIGPDGCIYYLSLGGTFDGSISKIRYIGAGNRSPIAVASANPLMGTAPVEVNFSGAGSSDPDNDPLTYTWEFGDGSQPQTGLQVSHVYNTNGRYNTKLRVSDGRGGSDVSEVLWIAVGNPPVGAITTPAEGSLYTAGDEIFFTGNANDVEDGELPASAFSWTIVFHHNIHTHPFLGPINGVQSGSFVIPRDGETSADVFYRIILTVTDSDGLQHISTRDVLPRTSTFTLATDPPGLQIHLDGQPMATPTSIVGVVGVTRTLTAPATQTLNGQGYQFESWSDGGAVSHTFDTPTENTTYLASYTPAPAATYLQRVNAGGGSYTGNGKTWDADKAFSAGSWGYVGGNAFVSGASIANTLDDPLYRSERWEVSSYRFTVPGSGQYRVELHFAEIAFNASGRRVFDVLLENQLVLDDLDIYAVVGANAALIHTFTTQVDDGVLDIRFRAEVENTKISAIEVSSLTVDTTPPVISAVAASNLSTTGATINWTTDEASDTQVEYGLTTSYGNSSPLNTALVTSHNVTLSGLAANTTYHYRVKSKDGSGNLTINDDAVFTTYAAVNVVFAPDNGIPTTFALHNYPNPFNAATRIHLALPEEAEVQLSIFDLSGREVKELLSGSRSAGHHEVIWDGRNRNGMLLRTGYYVVRWRYRIDKTGAWSQQVRRVLMVK